MLSERDEVFAVLDRLESAVDDLTALRFDALTTPERLRILERLETVSRRLLVAGHALINGVRQQATSVELGGKPAHALADRLAHHPHGRLQHRHRRTRVCAYPHPCQRRRR